MKIKLLNLLPLLLLLLPLTVQAQETSSLSILDTIKTLPLKEGFMYDFKHGRGLNTLGLEVAQFKGISLDFAYMGIDGLGATIDYSLASLPVQNVPVLKYVSYLNLGYGLGIRTLALNPTDDNPKSDNRLIQGPVVYLKFNF